MSVLTQQLHAGTHMTCFTELEKKNSPAVNLLLMNDLMGTNCQGKNSTHGTQTNHITIFYNNNTTTLKEKLFWQ